MSTNEPMTQSPIKMYYLYATNDRDEKVCRGLMKHLKIFERKKRIISWHPGEMLGGDDSVRERFRHLQEAQLILLLISADFIASEEIYTIDMPLAMERHARGEAYIVPILLSPGHYEGTPFADLKMLPDNGRPLTTWSNKEAAYANIAKKLNMVLNCLEKQQPVDFSAPTITQTSKTQRVLTPEQQRLLDGVYDFWIGGVLEQSLYNTVKIELGFHERPAAIDNPWRFMKQEMGRPEQVLRPGTSILTVYDEAGGELLLLGEPGTGKTTLLLELARTLIERAKQSGDHPLPVVLDLSSWSKKDLSLSAWLVKELEIKYKIIPRVAQQWIDTHQILPLLDGLNTVEPTAYPACIDALNAYSIENAGVPLVVCCQSDTYLRHEARVKLRNAVTIQPLMEQQIDEYLSSADTLTELRTLLAQNEELRTLATTPLWLTIVTLVVHNATSEDLLVFKSAPQSLKQRILALYVERVQKRGRAFPFTPAETERWLASLAQKMQKHHQRSFYLERIQPDWLSEGWLRVVYFLCMGCIGMVVFSLPLILVALLIGGQFWAWTLLFIGTLLGGVGFALASVKIRPIEVIANSSMRGSVLSFCFSVGLCLFILLQSRTNSFLNSIVTIAVICSLLLLLVAELLKNRPAAQLSASQLVTPDEGLRRSRQNGIWIGLFCASVMALIVLFLHLSGLLKENLVIIWSLTLAIGLICGLIFGGLAALQISLVHWLLRATGAAPKNYGRFLDAAAEHLLVYKIGGGYIFLHPLLQDYFASLSQDHQHPGRQ